MDLRTLTRLFVKIAGAGIIVWSVTGMAGVISTFVQITTYDAAVWTVVAGSILPVAVPLLVGVFLLVFPGVVTNVLVRGEDLVGAPVAALSEFERALYSLLGIYLVVSAISDAAYHYARFKLYYKIIEAPAFFEPPRMVAQDFAGIVATAVQLLVGIALVFGASALVRLFQHLRGRMEDSQ